MQIIELVEDWFLEYTNSSKKVTRKQTIQFFKCAKDLNRYFTHTPKLYECQIKHMKRYSTSVVKMEIQIRRLTILKCWWESRGTETLIHCCWEHIIIMSSSYSIAKYLPKSKGNICLYRILYMNVHSSFICNSQMFINRWMDLNGLTNCDIFVPWGTTQQ